MGTSGLKVLVAGGDSFVFGTELSDQKTGIPSKSTFPALLAHDASMHYQCVARPGSSNQGIYRQIVNYCETHKDLDLSVFVSWTFPNRYEFNFPGYGWHNINAWDAEDSRTIASQMTNFIQTVLDQQVKTNNSLEQAGVREFLKTYYKTVASSEYWETFSTLKEIVNLQNYLKLNSIKYVFTFADVNVLNNFTTHNADTDISVLYNQIDFDYVTLFPGGKGFYQWALENKYKVGATHPLEEAHCDAAKLIRDKFYEIFESTS